MRQTVRGTTECSLERGERPGRGSILVPIWLAAHLVEDAVLLRSCISLRLPTTVPLDDGIDPLLIKPRDQVSDGITTLSASGSGCRLITGTIRDGQEFRGASNLRRWIGP